MALVRVCAPLCRELARVFPQRPFALELWDGSKLAATEPGSPTFYVKRASALAHALRAPGVFGLGRAYVEGSLECDDLDAAFIVVDDWQPPALTGKDKARLLATLVLAAIPAGIPRRPRSELILKGERHSPARDAAAVRYHYDVGNEFFALFLDESMTYSCAIFSRGARTLEEAQRTKLELIAQKLELEPGQRVLDVGCGWGSFAIHAAPLPVSRTASRSGSPITASWATNRSTRSPRSGWPSTLASRRSTSTRERFIAWSSRAASFSIMRSA